MTCVRSSGFRSMAGTPLSGAAPVRPAGRPAAGAAFPLGVLLLCALAGCGAAGKQPGGQVVALVDGAEITASQVDQLVKTLSPGVDGATPAVKAGAMQGLIDESLMVAAAEKIDLDDDANVARQLDAARRSLLAQAWLDKVAPSKMPTAQDIERYYAAHPHFFVNRKNFVITDIPVAWSPGVDHYVHLFSDSGLSLEGLAAQFSADGIAATPSTSSIEAEALPDALARQFAGYAPGTTVTFRQGDVQHFVKIVDARPNPVSLQVAAPLIAARIQAEAREASVRKLLAGLRRKADIKMGDIGEKLMAANPIRVPAVSVPAAAPGESIKRGVSGL